MLMAELYGKRDGCCGGRGGTMHLYDRSVGLFGTNGLVGGGIPSAVGAAISAKFRGTDGVAVAFFGDGATNHAAFHEGMNFAGVRRAPVVFVCENNLYATATALRDVTLNPEIATRAAAYGIPGIAVDGNDVIAVWNAMRRGGRAGAARRGADADRSQDLSHRRATTRATRSSASTARRRRWTPGRSGARSTTFRRATDRGLRRRDRCRRSRPSRPRSMRIVKEAIEFARRSPEPEPATVQLHVYADPLNPAEAFAPAPRHVASVRDGLARRRARRHRRGDAPQLRYHLFRRRNG